MLFHWALMHNIQKSVWEERCRNAQTESSEALADKPQVKKNRKCYKLWGWNNPRVTFTRSLSVRGWETPLPARCWWHRCCSVAVQSGVGMSLWGLTAGWCHVVYSTGITAPNLPWKPNSRKKKTHKRSPSWNSKWWIFETRWKKGRLVLDHTASPLHLYGGLCKPDVGDWSNGCQVSV